MNNTVINLEGIHVNQTIVRAEHSTDTAQLLVIKDEHGNEVYIQIAFNKITDVIWKK
mgnify:FL=1